MREVRGTCDTIWSYLTPLPTKHMSIIFRAWIKLFRRNKSTPLATASLAIIYTRSNWSKSRWIHAITIVTCNQSRWIRPEAEDETTTKKTMTIHKVEDKSSNEIYKISEPATKPCCRGQIAKAIKIKLDTLEMAIKYVFMWSGKMLGMCKFILKRRNSANVTMI